VTLPRRLEKRRALKRGEQLPDWMHRVIATTLNKPAARKRAPEHWAASLGRLMAAELPALTPRYATVLRRIEFQGEDKHAVARELGLSDATMDVLLHRARGRLQDRVLALWPAPIQTSVTSRGAPARSRL
jgi:DNA-directed RNA polymerase specialized sigma24 family protein